MASCRAKGLRPRLKTKRGMGLVKRWEKANPGKRWRKRMRSPNTPNKHRIATFLERGGNFHPESIQMNSKYVKPSGVPYQVDKNGTIRNVVEVEGEAK